MESRLLAQCTRRSEPHGNRKASHPFSSCVRSIRYNRDISQPSAPGALVFPHSAVNRPVASEAMLLAIQRYIRNMAPKGGSVGFSDSVPVLKSPTAHVLRSRRRLPANGHK